MKDEEVLLYNAALDLSGKSYYFKKCDKNSEY